MVGAHEKMMIFSNIAKMVTKIYKQALSRLFRDFMKKNDENTYAIDDKNC